MSAEIIKLTASRRNEAGKGPSRRLRREGKSPAIAYGKELTPLALAVSPKELKTALAGPLGRNTVMELQIDGKDKMTVLVKQYAHHPVSREIVHADFIQIALDKPVDVQVPLKLVGKCKGVVAGGILGQVYRTLPVRCLPQKIPALLELDVTELGLNESMKTAQLVLPEGVTVTLSPTRRSPSSPRPTRRARKRMPPPPLRPPPQRARRPRRPLRPPRGAGRQGRGRPAKDAKKK
ncbi:MAG: 50S ribosomal protein L25 [Polyangiaceae bacterium]